MRVIGHWEKQSQASGVATSYGSPNVSLLGGVELNPNQPHDLSGLPINFNAKTAAKLI
jgi:hypothetical protein